MELSKHKEVNIIFFLGLTLFILSLAYLFYASEKSAQADNPSFIAYSESQGVIFGTDKNLYITDERGSLLSQFQVQDLGLSEYMSDLLVVDEKLYIADAKSHWIYKCPLPLKECKRIAKVPYLRGIEALKIAFSPDKTHFYVSSSSKHKIDYFNAQGDHLYELPLESRLRYPNSLAVTKEGVLIVADTNNHRVVGLEHKDRKTKELWEIEFEGKYSWPVYLALDKQETLWVASLDGFLEEGEILVIDDVYNPIQREIPSLKSLKPKQLQAMGETMLIADAQSFRFYQSDLYSRALREFGDRAFTTELQTLYEQKEFYETQITLSQALMILSILLLVIAAILEYKKAENKNSVFTTAPIRRSSSSGVRNLEEIQKDFAGIVWLQMQSKAVQKLKTLAMIVFGCSVVLVVAIGALGVLDLTLFVMVGILFISMNGVALFSLKLANQRIGIKGDSVYIQDLFKSVVFAPVEEVLFSGRRVIIKEKAISLYDGEGKPLFNEAQFEYYIVPLIEKMQTVNELQLFLEKVFRGDLKTWLLLILTLAMLISMFAFQYYGFI